MCKASTTVNPAQGLDAEFMTLDTTQSHVGSTSLLTDIQNIIINFMSKSNFRAALDAAVTYNVQKCRDNI